MELYYSSINRLSNIQNLRHLITSYWCLKSKVLPVLHAMQALWLLAQAWDGWPPIYLASLSGFKLVYNFIHVNLHRSWGRGEDLSFHWRPNQKCDSKCAEMMLKITWPVELPDDKIWSLPLPLPSTLAQSKERKGSNFAAQHSGAIVQKQSEFCFG